MDSGTEEGKTSKGKEGDWERRKAERGAGGGGCSDGLWGGEELRQPGAFAGSRAAPPRPGMDARLAPFTASLDVQLGFP